LYTVAIIPARSGSVRVRDKNIKPLAGYPLIYYTIKEAIRSQTLNRVIVSTDSKRYAKIAKKYGAEVPFIRPQDLSWDCPTEMVIQYAVKIVEPPHIDIVVTLQPTSPLRIAEDIDACVNKLIKTGADSVVTVCEVTQPPQWVFRLEKDVLIPFMDVPLAGEWGISQALPKYYIPNGAVYATKRDVVMKQNTLFGEDRRAVVMPLERSLETDHEIDFIFAEALLSLRISEKEGTRTCFSLAEGKRRRPKPEEKTRRTRKDLKP